MSDEDEIRVTFGDAPGNSLPLVTVEGVLRKWHEVDPEGMGEIVATVMFGVRPRRRPRRDQR